MVHRRTEETIAAARDLLKYMLVWPYVVAERVSAALGRHGPRRRRSGDASRAS